MASVTDVEVPAGVVHAVLGVLATRDTWVGEPVVDTLDSIMETVAASDHSLVPYALGEVLLPLRRDPVRCALALDIIRSFDLHEATHGLAVLLREAPTREAVVTAAAMSLHPEAPTLLTELVSLAAPQVAKSADRTFAERVQVLLTGRLPDGASTATALLLRERWPGRLAFKDALAPLVVLMEDAGPPGDQLKFLLDLRRAGAQVRRLRSNGDVPSEGWMPSWAVVVSAEARPAWWPKPSVVLTTGNSLAPGVRRRLMRDLRRTFKGRLALKAEELSGAPQLGDPLLDPTSFFDGALKIPEVSFMTGWRGSTLRSRGRQHPELRPHMPAHRDRIGYYDFAQVTALRVDHFIAAAFGRRPDPALAVRLLREARGNEAVPTHVTIEGDILFEHDDALADRHGQLTIKEVALADVVRTFELGSGRAVPELLHPSTHTEVHPSVQRGTPVVAGTRVSALAVRDVAATLRASRLGSRHLGDEVRRFFPELGDAQIEDAAAVGQQILA